MSKFELNILLKIKLKVKNYINTIKRYLKRLNYSIILFFPILLILNSCVIHKELEYVHDKDKSIKSFNETSIPDYKLKPDDELYIQISSLDETTVNMFGNSSTTNTMYMGGIQPYGASLISYSVNKDGYILIPVIGKILAKDKTISQLAITIKDSLSRILNQPLVTIKLVNRYISVIGEVKNPGHYSYSQEKLSIFDALGLGGDITDYGNRNQVILIRNENGKNLRISLDLTESSFLSSDYYFLRPNDIVYVKPLRKKFWGFNQFPFAIVLSALTTGILIVNYVK